MIILSFLINLIALIILNIIFAVIISWEPNHKSYIHRYD
jgi:hypothetical protein